MSTLVINDTINVVEISRARILVFNREINSSVVGTGYSLEMRSKPINLRSNTLNR